MALPDNLNELLRTNREGRYSKLRIAPTPFSSVGRRDTSVFRCAGTPIQNEFEQPTWKAFWRTAIDGQPAPEVAKELGMTPVAVRVAKHRVLKRLRDFMTED